MQIENFMIGKVGIEKGLDKYLRGQVGLGKYEVNASGKIIRKLGEESSSPGKDLHLTLDSNLLYLIREELIKSQQDFQSIGSAALLMDVNNGEILSLIS